MDISLTLTEDERHACRRAAALLRHLAGGLAEIGSRHEADACAGYATTLDAIVTSGECCAVSDDGKVDVEQAAFILEGIRDGLDNADLDEGSDFVQRDIERLNDVVFRYNSAAGKAVG
jgi:hypothetical protein